MRLKSANTNAIFNATGEHLPAVRLFVWLLLYFKEELIMNLYIPMLVVVLSNIFYHICSKSTPENIDPFASLTVTYAVGALCSAVLFFALNKGGNLLAEYKAVNWSTIILGIAIVGLEAGFIYMYKAGWNISTGQLVESAVLSICLIFVGALLYSESISLSKLAGIALCLGGLFLINR